MFLGGYLNVFYFHTALDLHTLDIIGCFFMITAGYFRPRVWKPKQKILFSIDYFRPRVWKPNFYFSIGLLRRTLS